MGTEDKDHKAVAEYYDEKQETEFEMCHKLNEKMPRFLRILGYFFEINCGNQYDTHDFNLIQIPPNRIKSNPLVTIEFEHGATQFEWDNKLPKDRWQALNLLTRKKYSENFGLFIKSSPTFNSIFAIDCRNNFVQNLVGKKPETLAHSLPFKTNDQFYRIYWKDVDKHLFVDDKENRILNNNNISFELYS